MQRETSGHQKRGERGASSLHIPLRINLTTPLARKLLAFSVPMEGHEMDVEACDAPAPSALQQLLDCGGGEQVEEVLAARAAPRPAPAVMEEQLSLLGDHVEGMCVECEDQTATVVCVECEDDFCSMCFAAQHRRGARASHRSTPIGEATAPAPTETVISAEEEERSVSERQAALSKTEEEMNSVCNELAELDDFRALKEERREDEEVNWEERAKSVPVRLQFEERKLLRLLEAALDVSEYTDRVDQAAFATPARRLYTQVLEVCGLLSGLLVAVDYRGGQRLCKDRSFAEHREFFQEVLEIGRRHKIMNPEKMRSAYGKLMYLLQDTVAPEMQELLEFSCATPIRTVHTVLEEAGALALLRDHRMEVATRAITEYRLDGSKKTRLEVRREVLAKEAAVKRLTAEYSSPKLDRDELQLCLYSIGDNRSFLLSSRDPIERTIRYLKKYFSPDTMEEGFSLAIEEGHEGARISHSHTRQYYYVLQSLTLWRDISHDMFQLWCHADEDLLSSTCAYELKDTGQGLHRVQQAPRVAKDMRKILHRVQAGVGSSWVGSSVVHLGDRNVPNALVFIDKYTQVPRILNPLVITLDRVQELAEDPQLEYYITQVFGGVERIRKDILRDFFRFAFDGSGADSFFEAGSCIDGRLTSAWNWCSQLSAKPFYPIFKLTGFQGFDGEFQQ